MQVLVETTLSTSAAIVLVLLLRGPIGRMAGWRVAYALWGMVPAAAIAVLLPAPERSHVLPLAGDLAPFAAAAMQTSRTFVPDFDWHVLGSLAWACGASLAAVSMLRRQRRFVRALGRLQRCEGTLWRAESTVGLPAVVGLIPKIVLPADFEARYGPDERALILAHERMHARRGDSAANALAAALRCLFWFNPLLAFAGERFRRDQELACDAAVMAAHPARRRAYAEAMLKTQLSVLSAPLACQWYGRHPLKERIAMLNSPTFTARRRMSGAAAVFALTFGTGYAAWAAQPERVQTEPSVATPLAAKSSGIGEDPRLKDRKIELLMINAKAVDVAARVANEVGLRFEGEIPNPAKQVTMSFNQIPPASILGILGGETGSRAVIENDTLRFVPAQVPPQRKGPVRTFRAR